MTMDIEQLILLTLFVYTLYVVAVVARSVVGVWRIGGACRRARLLLRDGGASDNSDRHTAGVTIIIVGPLSAGALEERLSIDYPYYELVWVANLRQVAGAGHIIERYDMAEVDFAPSEGLPCRGVERLYRSRARRYRRLVVVDCRAESVADCYNCATEVAGYDLLLPLDNRTQLSPSSLTLLVDAALSRRNSWVVAFAANRVAADVVSVAERLVLLAGGGGRGERVGGRIIAPLYLFKREKVIAEGGFVASDDPLGAMARSTATAGREVRRAPMRHSPLSHAPAVQRVSGVGERLLPLLLGSVTSGDVGARSLRNPVTGRYYTPVWVLQLWALWLLALVLSAPFEGYPLGALLLIGVVWLSSVVRATVAVVAALLLADVDGGVWPNRVGTWRVVLSPIFRIRDIILPKNFVK